MRRPPPRSNGTTVSTTRNTLVGAGILGAIAYGLTRWSQGLRARVDDAAARQESGELK